MDDQEIIEEARQIAEAAAIAKEASLEKNVSLDTLAQAGIEWFHKLQMLAKENPDIGIEAKDAVVNAARFVSVEILQIAPLER